MPLDDDVAFARYNCHSHAVLHHVVKKYGKPNLYKGYWLELNGLDAVLGKYFERREVLTLKELTEKKFGGGDDGVIILRGRRKWIRRASRTPSTPVYSAATAG